MSKKSNIKSFKRSDYITERKSGEKNKREKKSSNRKRGNGKGTVERWDKKLRSKSVVIESWLCVVIAI